MGLGDKSKVIRVYTIHKSSQLLSVWSISAYIQYIFKKYHYFSSNWLCSKFSLIYSDRGVKPDIFGDISVFSVFCWDASYLSWEASQQNFVFIFLLPLTPQTFGTIKKLGVSPSFTLAVKSTVNSGQKCTSGILLHRRKLTIWASLWT